MSMPLGQDSTARRNFSSANFCSVMSRVILAIPTITPPDDLTGRMLTETSILRPPLAARMVSTFSTGRSASDCATMAECSSRRSGGMMMSIFLPIASATVNPKRRSAAGFQAVMVPSSVLLMTGWPADSSATENMRSR